MPHTPTAPRDAVFWHRRPAARLPPLVGRVAADAVVVGGGMMGLMCAQRLAEAGRRVCVLESDTCGGGASGRSSGFITPDSELEFADLVDRFGRESAETLWTFAQQGGEAIRHALLEHEIPCDYAVQDALFIAAAPRAARIVKEEHAASAGSGIASEHLDAAAIPSALGAAGYHGAVHFGGTFSVDSYGFCVGLRDRLRERGVAIYESSAVEQIEGREVATATGAVTAPEIFLCTDHFLPRLGVARREVFPVQTFLGVTEPFAPKDYDRVFPSGPKMAWDTALIYRYFRPAADRRLLIGGGTLASTYAGREWHQPGAAARRFTRYLAKHFPGLPVTFAAVWPGLIGVTKDFAPVVGRHPLYPNIRFAGGAAGLPWAAALGRYLAEQSIGGRAELDAVLSVRRKFPVGHKTQAVIGARPAFALSHGMMKLGLG